jgi:flagellin
MTSGINNNRRLNSSLNELSKSFERLSSGKRINRASDDAAGLSIAANLGASVSVSTQARRNLGDATSALNIAEGAFNSLGDISNRLNELAAQAANGTLSDSQRTALNNEFSQLSQEAQRIVSTTQFNGTNLLSSDGISIQSGLDGSASSQLQVEGSDISSLVNSLSNLSVGTANDAVNTLNQLSNFNNNLSTARGNIGSSGSRIESQTGNLETYEVNAASARTRIEDADIADAIAKKTSEEIKLNIGAALNAQAGKLNKDMVLKLLS